MRRGIPKLKNWAFASQHACSINDYVINYRRIMAATSTPRHFIAACVTTRCGPKHHKHFRKLFCKKLVKYNQAETCTIKNVGYLLVCVSNTVVDNNTQQLYDLKNSKSNQGAINKRGVFFFLFSCCFVRLQ